MKSQARVVIIGGGMMGVGLLYHLAEEGWDDCILVEKGELTSGSTWHAAGQCPSFIADYNMAKMHHYSNTLYPKLEAMTGQSAGWHGCGGIRFAITPEELDYFRLVEGIAANVGFRMQIISPEECRRINPFVDTTGVIAGAWTLDDGHVDPSGCCQAMAIAARNMGATVVRHNRVTDVNLLPGGEWEVVTEQGNIICEHVVNAGGCYADRIGAWVGVHRKGKPTIWRRVRTDGGFGSANDPRLLVGLGGDTAIDRIEVYWPGGSVETWTDVAVDRYTTLSKGTGSKAKGGE